MPGSTIYGAAGLSPAARYAGQGPALTLLADRRAVRNRGSSASSRSGPPTPDRSASFATSGDPGSEVHTRTARTASRLRAASGPDWLFAAFHARQRFAAWERNASRPVAPALPVADRVQPAAAAQNNQGT